MAILTARHGIAFAQTALLAAFAALAAPSEQVVDRPGISHLHCSKSQLALMGDPAGFGAAAGRVFANADAIARRNDDRKTLLPLESNFGDPVGCPGTPLYSQQPFTPSSFQSYTSDAGAGLRRWDNFSSVGGAIDAITFFGFDLAFVGGNFEECAELNPQFEIEFRTDNAHWPGDVVCSHTLTATRIPTGILYSGAELNQYHVALPEPCVLVHGWVSIVGIGGASNCWFLWMGSPEGDDFSYCDKCQSQTQLADMSFCLEGDLGGIFGACCNQSTGACADNVEINLCTAAGTQFTPDTACADLQPACQVITGACCMSDGTCSISVAVECKQAGGDWLGADTLCQQCPPIGPCCISFEKCAMMTQPDCEKAGAAWLGQGFTCADCPSPPVCEKGAHFAQEPEGPDAFLAGTSEASAGFKRYENFSAIPGPIESLRWWGLDLDNVGGNNWAECVEADPTFDISFHEDAGGVPGDAVCTYTVLASRTPLNIFYLGAELNQYEATLPSPCVITNGWVSIVGKGDPQCWFLWMSSGVGESYCENCLPPPQGVDLSVCLHGQFGGVTGACCDDSTGQCTNHVDISQCASPGLRFTPETMCSALDPPCGTVLGACCMPDATCSSTAAGACSDGGGNWLGPNSLCDNCPCITPCPAGGFAEGEPVCHGKYVDVFNGGCVANTPAFSSIAPGQTVCGTSGIFENATAVPDFDWYEFNVPAPAVLRWTAQAEFRPQIWIVNGSGGCPGKVVALLQATECEELSVSATVTAGTHWMIIAPWAFTDSAACGARYWGRLDMCVGDIWPASVGDWQVNVDDLLFVINNWGAAGGPADSTGDGVVNVDDLLNIINHWGPC